MQYHKCSLFVLTKLIMLFGKTVKKILLNCSMNTDQLWFLNKLPEDLENKVEVFSMLQLKTATEKPVFIFPLYSTKTRICISS